MSIEHQGTNPCNQKVLSLKYCNKDRSKSNQRKTSNVTTLKVQECPDVGTNTPNKHFPTITPQNNQKVHQKSKNLHFLNSFSFSFGQK